MAKIDFKKELKHLYSASAKAAAVIEVPAMKYAMIDGKGNPNTSEDFEKAIEALFGISYTLKFMCKMGKDSVDYTVMGLEGLWWMEDMHQFSIDRKDEWQWTVMIMQPDFITDAMFKEALDQLVKKKNPPAAPKLRLETYTEGLSAQILHLGPYSEEASTIRTLHTYIEEHGLILSGKHHEIYLNDATRTAPENLKTILRQPIKRI